MSELSTSLQHEIEKVQAEIRPLYQRLESLSHQKRVVDSQEFIVVNRITRADVEMSSGEGKPFFGTVYEFIDWMRTNGCSRRWAEWNGRIYNAAELMAGRMDPSAPGDVQHLP